MKRLISLLIVACIAMGAAYYLAVYRYVDDTLKSQFLLGGLATEANELTAIKIENNQGVIFSAAKQDNQWLATHLDSLMVFPADISALSTLVNSLTQARIVEPKTALASQYSQLGVEPITQPNGNSVLVTITADSQQWKVLIGNLASSGVGRYVREPSQAHSYLIDQQLQLPVTAMDWLAKPVLAVDVSSLEQVSVSGDDGFVLAKNSVGEWQLEGNELPLAYPGVLLHTLNDMVNFEYESVSVAVTPAEQARLARQIHFTTTEQGDITLSLYRQGEADEGFELRLSGGVLAEQLHNWQFHLTDFQGRDLLTSKSDLIQTPQ